ncbi:MAG: nucleotidyl transferase AbiEii/AbiGii toxin family protein [Tannerella sp.]|jgi:hypothetical protein|nr:nucleotidyl transferase AbiEii/AbiGii toxin family protein [Tannerella sp.]
MNNWQSISAERQRIIVENISAHTGFSPEAIEKDWWVTMVLKALFQTSCADYLVFKGGTSLGKCWKLIERLSEDIDVAIFRIFFGISEISTKNQREKLRKASSKYIQDQLINELDEKLKAFDISAYKIELEETDSSDIDPRVIFVNYPSLFPESKYLKSSVKIEISCRSLYEPNESIELRSIIAENYPNELFADKSFIVKAVSPMRTFLKKVFLLHEALQKGRVHSMRMTRHLYDLHKLMDTDYAKKALDDSALYQMIVKHRSIMTREKGVDYSTLCPSKISFIPENEDIIDIWKKDYKNMYETFIGEIPIEFEDLMERMKVLLSRFRSITIDESFFTNL